ncbi:unnamed protein product [Heterobilharzia americana]|nr:unnamed protein product [Heterobilharzia americana]
MDIPADPPMYHSLFRDKTGENSNLDDTVGRTSVRSLPPKALGGPNPNEKETPGEKKPSLTYTVGDAVEASGFGGFQLKLFVLCGVISAADAMEMLLLSVLGPALRCYWLLSSGQVAAITTVVFAGFLFGAPLWGFIADRFGRWPTMLIVLSMITYFGVITSSAPNYVWIVILRLIVGFAIGGANSSFTLLSEFLTVKHRARVLLAFNVFWACGSTFEVGLAYLILPNFGWRWLVFASALPLMIFLILLKFLPESPRFLVSAGKIEEAERIIADLFRANRVTPLQGTLVSTAIPYRRMSSMMRQRYHVGDRGSIKGMFAKGYLVTTLMLPIIWFSAAFCYYGVVLLSAEIFRFRHSCFGGIPLMILMVDFVGRKITMATWNGLIAVLFMLLYICMPKLAMTALLFVLRALTAGLFSLSYVYTTEVYPTTVRAVAVGTFSSIARLGAMITPYVAQVMMPEVSQIGALSLYACITMLVSLISIFLPIETKGRELPSSSVAVPSEEIPSLQTSK